MSLVQNVLKFTFTWSMYLMCIKIGGLDQDGYVKKALFIIGFLFSKKCSFSINPTIFLG